jgi:hypothetical protein
MCPCGRSCSFNQELNAPTTLKLVWVCHLALKILKIHFWALKLDKWCTIGLCQPCGPSCWCGMPAWHVFLYLTPLLPYSPMNDSLFPSTPMPTPTWWTPLSPHLITAGLHVIVPSIVWWPVSLADLHAHIGMHVVAGATVNYGATRGWSNTDTRAASRASLTTDHRRALLHAPRL